jgi:hypothetical protein
MIEGVDLFKVQVCMYGITTIQLPCIINVWWVKNEIKNFK